MKIRFIVTFLILFTGLNLFGQNYYVITFEGIGDYENDPSHTLFIDTISNADNIWQIGPPQKNLFLSADTPPNAIVTDTVNYYPINDTSSFIIKHVASLGFSMPSEVYLGGKYFVNSDTLSDFGKIEFSPNNGTTWVDLTDPLYGNGTYWDNPYPLPIFTGNSNGWKQFGSSIQSLGPLFNIQIDDTVLFRFTFISDGIQTNKDGLMFDSLFVWDIPPIGIKNINSNNINISIYPNPSAEFINITLNQIQYEISTIKIYNNTGEAVKAIQVSIMDKKITIDISDFPIGNYLISFMDCNGVQIAEEKFIR